MKIPGDEGKRAVCFPFKEANKERGVRVGVGWEMDQISGDMLSYPAPAPLLHSVRDLLGWVEWVYLGPLG